MKINRFGLFLVALFSVLMASIPAFAAAKKSFDLYSWAQAGNTNYCYAILPSTKEAHTVAEIKATQDQVCGGRDDFKRIVGQAAPAHSKLNWKVDAANGLVLPPRDIVNDFKRFSETIPYKLVIDEPKS